MEETRTLCETIPLQIEEKRRRKERRGLVGKGEAMKTDVKTNIRIRMHLLTCIRVRGGGKRI